MNKHRIHYIFHGDVQGVGFRYTAARTAQSLGITGWVRNLYDGTVEMEAQGYMQDLIRMTDEIQHDIYISITDIERKEISLSEGENGFRIC